MATRWQQIASEELRGAGKTREEKKAALKRASARYRAEKEGHHESHEHHTENPRAHWIKPVAVGLIVIGGLYGISRLTAKPQTDVNPCPACQTNKYALSDWYTGPDPLTSN